MKFSAALLLVALLGCESDAEQSRGRALVEEYGCASCHAIPDVPGPHGATGPPLTEMARQAYVAGVLPNTRENLAAFIADPQDADPRSAMPDLGLSREEADAIAGFLYSAGRAR